MSCALATFALIANATAQPTSQTGPTVQVEKPCKKPAAYFNDLLKLRRTLTGKQPRSWRSRPVPCSKIRALKREIKKARRDCLRNLQHATASHYGRGDGFAGGPLACGGRLQVGQIGTAHKTLACGTILYFKTSSGKGLRVPVIDRGPFIPGREFDLTSWTADYMSFDGVGQVTYSTRNCWAR